MQHSLFSWCWWIVFHPTTEEGAAIHWGCTGTIVYCWGDVKMLKGRLKHVFSALTERPTPSSMVQNTGQLQTTQVHVLPGWGVEPFQKFHRSSTSLPPPWEIRGSIQENNSHVLYTGLKKGCFSKVICLACGRELDQIGSGKVSDMSLSI